MAALKSVCKKAASIVALACLATLASPAPDAAAKPPLPVPYGNLHAFGDVALRDWNGTVAGANDFGCKPSAAHPNPVVLVGSTFLSDAVNWTAVAPYLHNAGYCVFTINYGRDMYYVPPGIVGLDPLPRSAQQVADLVAKVRQATGAAKVDMVGHSQGGLVSRYFIEQLGGAPIVDKMVLLSSPFKATGLPIDVMAIARQAIPQNVFDVIENNGLIPPLGVNFLNPYSFGKATDHLTPSIRYTQITDIADEVGLYGGLPRSGRNAKRNNPVHQPGMPDGLFTALRPAVLTDSRGDDRERVGSRSPGNGPLYFRPVVRTVNRGSAEGE